MKLTSLLFVIIVSLLLSFTDTNAGEWITDSRTNCKVWTENPKPNKSVSWSGECVNGYASGSGTEIWYQDGKETERYEGQMKNGKLHGKGTYTLASGTRYEGDWVDDKRHGKGTYTFASGSRYEGDWVDDKRHGKGTYTWADGNKYVGDFVNGKQHGKGTIIFASGNKYEGDWVDGKAHGKGTYTCRNGRQFTGNFQNSEPVGFTIKCN